MNPASIDPNTPAMIIVGAGHAGGRAALTLRSEGYKGPLLLIGEEPHLPYERPHLSKGLLQGTVDLAGMSLCQPAQLAELNIQHLAGCRVRSLHPQDHQLQLDDGRQLHYSRLLLATGGRVRRLPGIPAHLRNLVYLRSVDDALAVREYLQPGNRLVIIGGGFIGLEVAASSRLLGCAVTLLEAGAQLAGRAVPPRVSAALLELHRAQGVDIRLNTSLAGVEGAQQVERVRLADGTLLACDLLLVGIGIEPNIELARAAGLDTGQGVRVDEQLRCSAPDIYAAGDLCEFRQQANGDYQRQETWRNAEDQGRHAALNMLGAGQPFQCLPGFWSDQYHYSLLSVGNLSPRQPCAQREYAGGGFILFYLDAAQRLQGAIGWGPGNSAAKDIKLCERLIASRLPLPGQTLADPEVSLKQLLRPAHA